MKFLSFLHVEQDFEHLEVVQALLEEVQ